MTFEFLFSPPKTPVISCATEGKMTRRRASTKRRKTANGATPSVQSPAAEEEVIACNVHEPSPAGNAIGCSFDLLAQILIHLPAKSLIQFKCVSKNWLSLISEPQFAGNHSRRNPRPSISGLYFYDRYQLKSLSLYGKRNLPSLAFVEVLGSEHSIRLVDSCNGLLLWEEAVYEGNYSVHKYIVCNVTTQKYRIVPKLSSTGPMNPCAVLAFDPSKSPHYKVVLVSDLLLPCEIHVFYSQSGCWKQFFSQHECDGPGVYWNGAIHWVGYKNFCLKFDLDAEEMIAIPNPPPTKLLSPRRIRFLGECGGRLFLIQCSSLMVLGFRILELSRSGWCRRYQVNFRPIIAAFPEIETSFKFYVLSLLCEGNGEKKEDFTLVLAIPGRIISYNLHRKTFDELCDLPGELSGCGGNGYPFIETLSPV